MSWMPLSHQNSKKEATDRGRRGYIKEETESGRVGDGGG